MFKNKKGFTLIELLIVIAIIAILAAVVFVALDPLTRFQDARNARRWSDADAVLSAIKLDQVDNGGSYHANVSGMTAGTTYMVVDGVGSDPTGICGLAGDNRVNLDFLVTEGYLGDVPVSPNGTGTWTSGTYSGYTMSRSATNALTITACETEGGTVTITR